FSDSSRDLVARVWPHLSGRILVRPHRMPLLPARVPPPRNERPVIGVLGGIGYEKGAAVLCELAKAADERLKIVVIGEMDMAYRHAAITVHGRYRQDEIAALARR